MRRRQPRARGHAPLGYRCAHSLVASFGSERPHAVYGGEDIEFDQDETANQLMFFLVLRCFFFLSSGRVHKADVTCTTEGSSRPSHVINTLLFHGYCGSVIVNSSGQPPEVPGVGDTRGKHVFCSGIPSCEFEVEMDKTAHGGPQGIIPTGQDALTTGLGNGGYRDDILVR